jgi:hypothetical protein
VEDIPVYLDSQYFNEQFNKCNSKCILIPYEKREEIDAFVQKVIIAKSKEKVHQHDGRREPKRWKTGRMGECALEILFKKKFADWEIGHSDKFSYADLKDLGVDIGIKTVDYGSFPLVHKHSKRAEIICVTYGNRVYVLGLATPDILNTYSDQKYVRDANALDRKTGFYGFDKLIPIHSYEDLMEHACKLNLLI